MAPTCSLLERLSALDPLSRRIAFVLYGQALGDAYGMPGELWPYETLKEKLGEVTSLVAGHPDNPASAHFEAGSITDDTQMALAIADALIENGGLPHHDIIAKHILIWADSHEVWDKNILGPSSSAALKAIREGTPIDELTNGGETNGSVMRISPVGCALKGPNILDPAACDRYIELVYATCAPTHKSDVAVAGAVLISALISYALDGCPFETLFENALTLARRAEETCAKTFSAKVSARTKVVVDAWSRGDITRENAAYVIRDVIGAGMLVIETVPSAVLASLACRHQVKDTARLCANLGGDTDTIGAIACALSAALHPNPRFDEEELELLERVNDLRIIDKAQRLAALRATSTEKE